MLHLINDAYQLIKKFPICPYLFSSETNLQSSPSLESYVAETMAGSIEGAWNLTLTELDKC